MGQGQADVAMELLKKCASEGSWLLLKNLHLVVSWLPSLEKEIFALQPHKDFRLFLTSEPHSASPGGPVCGGVCAATCLHADERCSAPHVRIEASTSKRRMPSSVPQLLFGT